MSTALKNLSCGPTSPRQALSQVAPLRGLVGSWVTHLRSKLTGKEGLQLSDFCILLSLDLGDGRALRFAGGLSLIGPSLKLAIQAF